MIDEEEVYDYLEHFGVVGMKWGRRKASGSRLYVGKSSETAKAKTYRRRKAVIATSVGGAAFLASSTFLKTPVRLAIGGVFGTATNALLNKHYDKKLSELE